VLTPSLLAYPFWRKFSMLPAQPSILALWVVLTLAIGWWVVLTTQDRQDFADVLHRLLPFAAPAQED